MVSNSSNYSIHLLVFEEPPCRFFLTGSTPARDHPLVHDHPLVKGTGRPIRIAELRLQLVFPIGGKKICPVSENLSNLSLKMSKKWVFVIKLS